LQGWEGVFFLKMVFFTERKTKTGARLDETATRGGGNIECRNNLPRSPRIARAKRAEQAGIRPAVDISPHHEPENQNAYQLISIVIRIFS